MVHVTHWLSAEPTKLKHNENNKPPHRADFLPALRRAHGDRADEQSIKLERDVVLFVQERFGELNSAVCKPYLKPSPQKDIAAYNQRFAYPVWKDLLQLVCRVAGPHLEGQAVREFTRHGPHGVASKTPLTIADTMVSVVPQVREVAQNPALNKPRALAYLHTLIADAVLRWGIQECQNALLLESLAESEDWPVSTIEFVRSELERFQAMLTGQESPLRVSPPQSSRPASPGLFVSPAPSPLPQPPSAERPPQMLTAEAEGRQPDPGSPPSWTAETPKADNRPSRQGETNITAVESTHERQDPASQAMQPASTQPASTQGGSTRAPRSSWRHRQRAHANFEELCGITTTPNICI
jgi:hypothetical protein